MIRHILIGLALLATQPVSDYWVDWKFKREHQSQGYTRSERDSMKNLLERTRAKPKQRMSAGERAAALSDLFGEGK